MITLLIWLAITTVFLTDMQIIVGMMGGAVSPTGRQLWLACTLSFLPAGLLVTPYWRFGLYPTLAALAIHLLAHLWSQRALVQRLTPAPAGLADRVTELCRRWSAPTPSRVMIDAAGDFGPAVMGIWRQTLVLPAYALDLPENELAVVVAHEAAHLHRRDPLKLWLTGVARSLTGWHPLTWPLLRELPLELELAADRQAAAWLGDARSYAITLGRLGLRQAEASSARPRFGLALAGHVADLVVRVRALTEPDNTTPHLGLPPWLGARLAGRTTPTHKLPRRKLPPMLFVALLSGGYFGIYLLLLRLAG